MKDLKGYRSNLDELKVLIDKLENGELSIDELATMEELTRNLHERSIILKYKAFESHVGVEPAKEEKIEPVLEEPNPVIFEKEEEKEEEEIDFSMFGSSEPEAESVIEETVIEEEPEEEIVLPEPEVEEHISVSQTEEVIDDIVETKVEVTHTTTSSSFLDKLNLNDNSLAGQFGGGKLETLQGAFGLNQRLRFINNLFDGSSELFSDAVKVLDTQDSFAQAKEKAEAFANEHEWDPEEENVIEFMTYVNRRYE